LQAEAPRLPAWNWSQLTGQDFERNLRDLAAWVQRMETDYGEWLQLPPCWPLHVGVREELALFWYWHRYAQRVAETPYEGVRWHHEFRAAADAWRSIASCKHEEPVRYRAELEKREAELGAQFLERAVTERAHAATP
jgi:hypothetical protein